VPPPGVPDRLQVDKPPEDDDKELHSLRQGSTGTKTGGFRGLAPPPPRLPSPASGGTVEAGQGKQTPAQPTGSKKSPTDNKKSPTDDRSRRLTIRSRPLTTRSRRLTTSRVELNIRPCNSHLGLCCPGLTRSHFARLVARVAGSNRAALRPAGRKNHRSRMGLVWRIRVHCIGRHCGIRCSFGSKP
jgi:hypothetical protein